MKNKNTAKGFSLIELSIVLIVIGLVMAPFMAILKMYYKEKGHRVTHENLKTISLALGQYYSEFSYFKWSIPLPCKFKLKQRRS